MSTMNVPFDRRFSSIVADFSVTRYSRVFFILMKILGTWNRVQIVQWTYPLIADFPRSMPISLTPCIVGYFSPLRKVFWTWNRIQWVQWMYHLIADFPRSLPIFQSPGIVGIFIPYENTRDVKPRPNSTMNVPVDCRFSSIVADFSYTLYSRVFFTPKESILDVKPHPMSTMNVPFDRRFSSIAADFSVTLYSRLFPTP